MVAVVQLVRASDCGSECRGFGWLERQIVVLNVVGSSPICHPKIERKFSNDFPLYLLYTSDLRE